MKIKKKRSKSVYGRKPQGSFYVKETIYEELFPGGPKKPFEKFYTVDDFTSSHSKQVNYG